MAHTTDPVDLVGIRVAGLVGVRADPVAGLVGVDPVADLDGVPDTHLDRAMGQAQAMDLHRHRLAQTLVQRGSFLTCFLCS